MKKLIYWVQDAKKGGDTYESGATLDLKAAQSAARHEADSLSSHDRERSTISVQGKRIDIADGETPRQAYRRWALSDDCGDPEYYEDITAEVAADEAAGSAAEEIAERLRDSDEWIPSDCAALCEMAGMAQEWAEADGESFERVVEAAAAKLGVDIYA